MLFKLLAKRVHVAAFAVKANLCDIGAEAIHSQYKNESRSYCAALQESVQLCPNPLLPRTNQGLIALPEAINPQFSLQGQHELWIKIRLTMAQRYSFPPLAFGLSLSALGLTSPDRSRPTSATRTDMSRCVSGYRKGSQYRLSHDIQDTKWSHALQHGPGHNVSVVFFFFKGTCLYMSEPCGVFRNDPAC